MISIKFNNADLKLDPGISLQDLLNLQAYPDPHFAVALNFQFVPRTLYSTTILNEGDLIEIVTPMQGG